MVPVQSLRRSRKSLFRYSLGGCYPVHYNVCFSLPQAPTEPTNQEPSLLDLLGSPTMQSLPGPTANGLGTEGGGAGGGALLDLLEMDASSLSTSTGTNPVVNVAPGTGGMTAGLMDLLGGGGGTATSLTISKCYLGSGHEKECEGVGIWEGE